MNKSTLPSLDRITHELANARKVLSSVKEANRHDRVWNEHVMHSESVAEDLVKKLEQELSFPNRSLQPANQQAILL